MVESGEYGQVRMDGAPFDPVAIAKAEAAERIRQFRFRRYRLLGRRLDRCARIIADLGVSDGVEVCLEFMEGIEVEGLRRGYARDEMELVFRRVRDALSLRLEGGSW